MKPLTASAIAAATTATLTNQDWILIIGIIITVLNMIVEYIAKKKEVSG